MFELIIAFGAGLISFLSPCVLPLIPGYISYISGNTLDELVENKNVNLLPTILFTIGFSIVFIIFGAASTFFWIDLQKNLSMLFSVVDLEVRHRRNIENLLGCVIAPLLRFPDLR